MEHDLLTTSQVARVVLVALLLAATCHIHTSDVGALPDASVVVEPHESSSIVGEVFSLNVTIVDVYNLYGLDVMLGWNSSVLLLVGVEVQLGQDGGALNPPIYMAENSTLGSRYIVAAASMSPAPSFNGTGNIVCLSFSVIDTGMCELDLQTQLYDYPPPDRDPRLSLPIVHTDVDGLFQSTIPEFPEPLVLIVAIVLTLFSAVLTKHASNKHDKCFRKSVPAGVLS